MFTGIIQNLGQIKKIEQLADSTTFYITASDGFFSDTNKGASVAVNGVCLTVEENTDQTIQVTAVKQTLDTTVLGTLQENEQINLELPCRARSLLGGHIVTGHVDGVAEVLKIEKLGTGHEVWFKIPSEFHKYINDKGSIAIDGVSMTIAEKTDAGIKLAVIPETLATTRFGIYRPDSKVNFEVDIIGKYVESLLQPYEK